eukprot:scaffold106215_cov70-Phaeocystis_antarctica.AAC.5
MAFVLPASKYTTVEQAPTPTDPRVTLRQLPERVQVQVSEYTAVVHSSPHTVFWVPGSGNPASQRYAVRTFTWSFKPEAAKTQLQLLLADLAKDEWTVVMRDGGEAVEWQAAR